jgi:glycosyltransferase involved in cell wall biosynthesis
MQKIAIDCRMLGMSGIGVYLQSILPHLFSYKETDFILIGDVVLLQQFAHISNVKVISCTIRPFSIQELYSFPIKEVNSCDVFYTPNFNIPSNIRIPIFSTIHDVVFLDFPRISGYFGTVVRWLMLRRAVCLSKKIFTVSHFSKDRIIHYFGNKKEILITYNGISREIKEISHSKRKFDFEYILYVGNIKRHKGLDILLAAYNKCMQNEFPYKLVIVGNAENFRTQDTVVKNILSQQSENIIFAGQVDNDVLGSLIENAHLLVQPSRYEGFGIPPLEALYLKTPVIVSDIAVFKEVYANFPVIYFENGNPDDLAEKMCNQNLPIIPTDIKNIIDAKYNYRLSAEVILNTFRTIEN